MDKNSKIFIAGDKDILRTSFIRYFEQNGFINVLDNVSFEVDLMNQDSVRSFFKKEKPGYVFLNHIKSYGIAANIKCPADLMHTNLEVQNNIIQSSFEFKVKKMLFLASSCVYPADSSQAIKESCFLNGRLEETSAHYAVSKIAGIKMSQAYNLQHGVNFISAVPATIYGPYDEFDSENSHVMAALVSKFYGAKIRGDKEVVVWGRGIALREFIYVEDVVKAAVFLMNNYDSPEIINIGVGEDISIKDLALLIKDVVGFRGKIVFDESKPVGVLKKLLDSSKINVLGWSAEITLEEGIYQTYEWYKNLKKRV
ncbi:MAG: GDP-L-fucose synthase [Candidatus Saelkia tenebricola]|nr:GDP-L-fucose synthase [Candidatus Saelkia tenebricola]